jgi:sporulation protein YlmC with PRC-barrel domain
MDGAMMMATPMTGRDNAHDRGGDVARHETSDLISADRVEGTTVFDAEGRSVGTIETVMIGKRDGQVAYAVLSFGGFLGIGTNYYPIPWNKLTYGTSLDGYVVAMTKEQIEAAPSYTPEEWRAGRDRWNDPVDAYWSHPMF